MWIPFERRFVGSAIMAIVMGLGSSAFEPLRAETLLEALQTAYRANPKLNAERARTRADHERIPQAFSGFLPNVSGDMTTGMERQYGYRNVGVSYYRPQGAGINLSQPIYNGLRNVNDYGKAKQEVASSNATLLATEAQILTQGGAAYMRVVRDRKNMALRRANLGILREQLNQAEERVKAGDLTRTAIDQTRARLSEAEADHAQAEADLADSEAFYRAVIGDHPGVLFAPNISRIALPGSAQEAIVIAERENPAIRAAIHSRVAAEYAVSSAKGAFLPTLSLEASYRRGFEESPINNYDIDTANVKLRLGIPIFDGGLNASRLRQARETETQRTFEVEDTLTTARRSVKSSFELQRGMRIKKAAAARRVASAEMAVKGLQIEFNAGQIPIIELLDGRRELINARISHATVENDEIFAVIQLLAAIGRLDMQTVANLTRGSTVSPAREATALRKGDILKGKGKNRVAEMPEPASRAAKLGLPKPSQETDVTGSVTTKPLPLQSAFGVEDEPLPQVRNAAAPTPLARPSAKTANKTKATPIATSSTASRNPAPETPATTAAPAGTVPAPATDQDSGRPVISPGLVLGPKLGEDRAGWSAMISTQPIASLGAE